jgi:hypothetical protein
VIASVLAAPVTMEQEGLLGPRGEGSGDRQSLDTRCAQAVDARSAA